MTQGGFPAILVVEDEPHILIVLRRILRDLTSEYDIVAVPDALAALDYMQAHPVALVITDYIMPEMSGLELARQVKDKTPGTPVIMVTSYGTRELEQAARQAGIQRVLRKPFALEGIEQAVREALGMPPE